MLTPADANQSHFNVTEMAKSNSHKTNVMVANHAMQDNNLLIMFARPQDHNVIATKSTTNLPTFAFNAESANSQEMESTDNKTEDAKLSTNNAMLEVKFNSIKPNAMLVQHAQVDNVYKVINALHQDQFAIAIKNTTKQPTHV
jgi:hypothetical protein